MYQSYDLPTTVILNMAVCIELSLSTGLSLNNILQLIILVILSMRITITQPIHQRSVNSENSLSMSMQTNAKRSSHSEGLKADGRIKLVELYQK